MKDKFIKLMLIIFIVITFIFTLLLTVNNITKPKTIIEQNVNIITDGTTQKININKATKEELMCLPGIGEVKAANIIEYRSKNRIDTIEELDKVKGIGQETIKILRELVTL